MDQALADSGLGKKDGVNVNVIHPGLTETDRVITLMQQRAQAHGINNQGVVVGSSAVNDRRHAFLYYDGTMHDLQVERFFKPQMGERPVLVAPAPARGHRPGRDRLPRRQGPHLGVLAEVADQDDFVDAGHVFRSPFKCFEEYRASLRQMMSDKRGCQATIAL